MQIHRFMSAKRIDYPVGERFMFNKPIMVRMGRELVSFLKNTYPGKKQVDIICMGSSGAIVSAVISEKLMTAKYNVVIRHYKKDGEFSHNLDADDIPRADAVLVIADDFISTGQTVRRILNHLKELKITRKVDVLCVSYGATSVDGESQEQILHALQRNETL